MYLLSLNFLCCSVLIDGKRVRQIRDLLNRTLYSLLYWTQYEFQDMLPLLGELDPPLNCSKSSTPLSKPGLQFSTHLIRSRSTRYSSPNFFPFSFACCLVAISPVYMQINCSCGISSKQRIPHPHFSVLNT